MSDTVERHNAQHIGGLEASAARTASAQATPPPVSAAGHHAGDPSPVSVGIGVPRVQVTPGRACDLCDAVSTVPDDDYECPLCVVDHNACCLAPSGRWCVRCEARMAPASGLAEARNC